MLGLLSYEYSKPEVKLLKFMERYSYLFVATSSKFILVSDKTNCLPLNGHLLIQQALAECL